MLLQKEEEAWEDYDDEDEVRGRGRLGLVCANGSVFITNLLEQKAIDMSLDIVWAEYDKKGEKVIQKKVAMQFFKDALTLFAMRKGKEPKHIFAEKGIKVELCLLGWLLVRVFFSPLLHCTPPLPPGPLSGKGCL